MKKFICGLVVGTMCLTTMPAFAESTQAISAIFGRVKLVVSGKPVAQETLLYNGTTYVPIRAVSEVLDKEVTFDSNTSTAYIDDKGTNRDVNQGTTSTNSTTTTTPTTNADLQASRAEYISGLDMCQAFVDAYGKGITYMKAGSYKEAKICFDRVIESADMVMKLDNINSKVLDADLKTFANNMKASAIQANLANTAYSNGDKTNGDKYFNTLNSYTDKAFPYFDKILEDSKKLV